MDEIYEKGIIQELKDTKYSNKDVEKLLYELYNATGEYSEEDIMKAIIFLKYYKENK